MRKISIYNNFQRDNQDRRELLAQKIKDNGFSTGKDGEFMFVIGGDGTFLKAIQRNMRENPIFIGINAGNLGFLSEFKFEDVDHIFDMIKKKQYSLQTLPIYEAVVTTKSKVKRLYFVNDLVVERDGASVIHTDININDEKFCTLSGDGVILSTALGSTGYCIAAGGCISYDCDVMQMTPINPLHTSAYRSLMNSVILNSSNEVSIFPGYKKKRPIRIACDGHEINLNDKRGKGNMDIRSIVVKKSPFKVRLLRSKGFKNIDNLRVKILDNE